MVLLAAAKVGGILANDRQPAEFLYDNLVMETSIIEASRRVGVEKLLFLGSSCIYPKLAPQPLTEDALLTGPLEPTNEWYAVAKIAGIKLCQAYRRQYGCDYVSVMPTNLYGPGDNFDLGASHVIPALMVKAHRAKLEGAPAMEVWGSGRPLREFLHVDDLADACLHVLKTYSGEGHLNIGSGVDVSIRDLATADLQGRRLPGRAGLRRLQARRHAAQADGRLAPRRHRLDRADAAGAGAQRGLRLFLEQARKGEIRGFAA